MAENKPGNKPVKKSENIINIILTILVGLTLPRVGKALALIFCAAISAVLITTLAVSFMYRETILDTSPGQRRLLELHSAIKNFQSEQYFAKLPRNLRELAEPPRREIIFANKPLLLDPLPLVESPVAFTFPGHERPVDGVSDFWFVPYYEWFLPANAIILMDRPGNYSGGGNIVMNDGKIEFLALPDNEYARFAEAIMARRDRNFVRQKSVKCSLAGFSE